MILKLKYLNKNGKIKIVFYFFKTMYNNTSK